MRIADTDELKERLERYIDELRSILRNVFARIWLCSGMTS